MGLLLFWAESTKFAIKRNFKRVYLPYMDYVLGGFGSKLKPHKSTFQRLWPHI
ncbi:hypothetical protein HYC85_030715 [Camellia sinensis]|uniref:Uncharacterized protein n=1 Tax=Camellia sinensis TaxID=4442 RepID=A0A7J7G5C8_CAMSI|nr:hypothetical protein HYC85_030715 [Camellia sinensis]